MRGGRGGVGSKIRCGRKWEWVGGIGIERWRETSNGGGGNREKGGREGRKAVDESQ